MLSSNCNPMQLNHLESTLPVVWQVLIAVDPSMIGKSVSCLFKQLNKQAFNL